MSCPWFFLQTISLLFAVVLCLPSALLAETAGPSSTTSQPHEIVIKNQKEKPPWMRLWDEARVAARKKQNQKAVALYAELFSQKPRIEEALREYVLILMDLDRWQEARGTLQKLLEIDPASLEYLLYEGIIALRQKRYQQASNSFGQVYTMFPDGVWAVEALQGQIAALQKLQRKDLAYPLMEQLYLLGPSDETSLRNLAEYSLELENPEKAKGYYRMLFSEFQGNDNDFLAAEPLFVAASETDMAVYCWTSYLGSHPYYLPFHRKLAGLYLTGEERDKALPHLLVMVAHGEKEPVVFLQIGKLYLYEEGRPDKALYYYDEYRKRSPEDRNIAAEIKRIQAVLAHDLLVIVENEGAWPLWRDLAKVIPDRLAVYYSIAEQLESLGKEKELLEVLEIISQHNPADQKVLMQLAQLYFSRGDLSASDRSLDSLSVESRAGRDYFFLRAGVAGKRGRLDLALSYYKDYLQEFPFDYPVVLDCMRLAGELSSYPHLKYFHSLLPAKDEDMAIHHQGSLLYGRLLLANFLPSTAKHLLQQLLSSEQLSETDTLLVEKEIVKTLQAEKRYFTAEQHLRQLLIKENGNKETVGLLIENSLLEKDYQSAWKWFKFMVMEGNPEDHELLLWEVSILEQSDQLALASEMIEEYLEGDHSPCPHSEQQCQSLKIRLAELYAADGSFREAETLLVPISTDSTNGLQVESLTGLVRARLSPENNKCPISASIDRALLYEKYGDHKAALNCIEKYLQTHPESLKARVLHVNLLMAAGDDRTALALVKKLEATYPEESSFRQTALELQFAMSQFADLLDDLAPDWKTLHSGGPLLLRRTIPPAMEALPTAQKLLLARTLWAVRRWDAALLLYETLLQSPVDREFSQELQSRGVSLTLAPVKKSFWNIITFTTPVQPDRLTVVMDPDFTRENLKRSPVSIASGLYAAYRWQQIVARELSVRQAMVDGNYYQAMKEYQKLIQKDPSVESLFDLAGVYSRLGFSGKEAAIYERIQDESPGYPDLDEAIRRNSLKRQPRASLLLGNAKKSGRGGYHDNRQKEVGLQSWFMPSLNHEVLVDYRRIFSESDKTDLELWRNRLEAEIKWSPLYDLDFMMSIGADRRDDDYGHTLLYGMQVNGRIGDMVQGYFGLSQDMVDDTVAALMDGVNKKEYETGLNLDFLPRLFGGGQYQFTEYSDGNHQNRYELWTSYILNSEPRLLQLRYGYEYSHNANTNKGRDYSLADGFLEGDHPYWSPKEFWQHLFTVSFEHQLAEDVLGRSAPSYYSLEYSFGYEAGGYDNHQLKAKIFLEMSRHFLLNSSLDLVYGTEYEEQNFLVSLLYRW